MVRARSWIVKTFLGWLLGVPAIALLAPLGEAVGIGGSQALVGAGMGGAVGLVQGRAFRSFRIGPWRWCLATLFGLALPFVVYDLGVRFGAGWSYSLTLLVGLGGVGAGILQAVVARGRISRPIVWAIASAVGWSLAGLTASRADSLLRAHAIRGVPGALLYLGLVALGGVVLGAVTAPALRLSAA